MKWGIGSYSLAWSIGVPGYPSPSEPLTASGLLNLAAQHDIRLVQIADNIPLHTFAPSDIRSLAEQAASQDISLEIGTRGTKPEHLLQYLDIARQVGSPLVRTLISEPSLEQAAREIAVVLPHYEQAGVTLAIENHGLHTTTQLRELFDTFAHPLLGCCLDTVNSFGALEAPDDVIRALAPYTVNVHYKDFDIQRVDHQMGFVVLGTPAGQGRLNMDTLMTAMRQAGKSYTMVLELWPPFTESVDQTVQLERQWLQLSIDYFKSIDFQTAAGVK